VTKAGALGVVASVLLVATSARAAAFVPELDPGSASLGVTLLIGGWLVLNGRRKR